VTVVALPAGLVAAAAGRPADVLLDGPSARHAIDGDSWLRGLPRTVADVCADWELTPDGPARHGACAIALPVVSADGPAMLKVTWPHHEAAGEHLALRHWGGQAAVRLLRAGPCCSSASTPTETCTAYPWMRRARSSVTCCAT